MNQHAAKFFRSAGTSLRAYIRGMGNTFIPSGGSTPPSIDIPGDGPSVAPPAETTPLPTTYAAPPRIPGTSLDQQYLLSLSLCGTRPDESLPPDSLNINDLPPYNTLEDSPANGYTSTAHTMFVYGCRFPFLWFVGVGILCYALCSEAAEIPGDLEGRRIWDRRNDEIKWGTRCLFATLSLLSILGMLSLASILGLKV